jgi:flavodoxin
MRRIFKIMIALFALLVIGVGLFAALIFGDLASYTATGSEVRTPPIAMVGKALVVYDPGLSGTAKAAASTIADDLQAKGYEVTFAGVRNSAAGNTSGFDVIVVGGPIYAGAPTASIQGYLNSLNPQSSARVGVFGRGNGPADSTDQHVIASEVAPLSSGSTLSLKFVMKIGDNDNVAAMCQQFVTSLLSA